MTDTKLIKREDAARLAGVTTRTLKRWEKAGVLTPHRDPDSGRLYYEESQIAGIASDTTVRRGGDKTGH